ncbi:MAG: VOC family protein [Candidatus Binataceae bacterium]
MTLGEINHLDITVTNLERSLPFYTAILKFLGYETPGSERVFKKGGSEIALERARPESTSKAHDRYAPGLHHLAFTAESRDEVDRLYELLKQMNARILDPPAIYYQPDYYAMFFADPDGIKLELCHRPEKH